MGIQTYDEQVGRDDVTPREYYGELLVDEWTQVDKIPTGQRVLEIMREKGKAYTLLSVAPRVGMKRQTLSNKLNGTSDFYNYELDKILQVLKVSRERFLQSDTRIEYRLFKEALHEADYEQAMKYLEKMHSMAIGVSERCRVHLDIGLVCYHLKQYDQAHEHWLKAKDFATLIQKHYGNSERLYDVLRNLMTSFTVRKEYSHALDIIRQVEEVFRSHPERWGVLCYSVAVIAKDCGDIEKYYRELYRSLDSFLKTDNPILIGTAKHNVGYIEYQKGNFNIASKYFEEALALLESSSGKSIIVLKDYVKVLLELNQRDLAVQYIRKALQELYLSNNKVLLAKFLVLLSMASDETEHAESVLTMEGALRQTQVAACRFLVKYYSRTNDHDSLVRYYRMEESLVTADSNTNYDWEGL